MDKNVMLERVSEGVWVAPGARIIDRTGAKCLPIGNDGFESAIKTSVLVDKTMLVADVLDSGYTATLFCRPRRFGKTLNMTMLKTFFEIAPDGVSRASLFEGTEVWEAKGGRYREHQGAYPVICVSFRTAKGDTWPQTYAAIKEIIASEYGRHANLLDSDTLDAGERERFLAIKDLRATEGEYAGSLLWLAKLLRKHYGKHVVVLIDEYDAPVMAGFSAPDGGYYREVVSFLKGWLTGALKDGGVALEFACLTGVQRISKESIFSDLNNLVVSTSLSTDFDERFGFTDAEMCALATYLGHAGCIDEARAWYDGYRFGRVDVYNPWSTLNYLRQGCAPDVYWGNTSSNFVVGDLVAHANDATLAKVYALMEPGGTVRAPLDLGVVFPDVPGRSDALWSMLYLAGYLTTEDTALPNRRDLLRALRIPNREVAQLYRAEVIDRFAASAGGRDRLDALHEALATGDAPLLEAELGAIARDSASYLDLTSENSVHMLVLGLCFGIPGYDDPASNRERGHGRPDIQLVPARTPFFSGTRPLATIELKYVLDATADELRASAGMALRQIAERGYDEGPLPELACGRIRWGIAFCGKRVAAACEQVG